MTKKNLQGIIQSLKQLNVVWEKLPAAFYVVDEAYNLQWLSSNARQWFPRFQEGAPKCYQALWHRESPCPQCSLSASSYTQQLRIGEDNGLPYRIYETFTAPLNLSQQRAYFRMILDVTRSWKEQQTQMERHQLIETIFNTSSDAIIFLDNNDRIVQWNRGAERLFGYTA